MTDQQRQILKTRGLVGKRVAMRSIRVVGRKTPISKGSEFVVTSIDSGGIRAWVSFKGRTYCTFSRTISDRSERASEVQS